MSSYIHNEILLFFQFAGLGAALLLSYDVLVIWRGVLPHSSRAVALEDILYWLGTGLYVSVKVYETNQGMLRAFLFLGAAAGIFLCHITVSPLFRKICTRILEIPFFLLKKPIKRLLFLGKRCKIWMYESAGCRIRRRKRKSMFRLKGSQSEKVKGRRQKKQNRV